jgi:hypothetical protein
MASPEEVARLRREASGKPDHPLWQKIAVYERRLRNGPDVTRIQMFAQDAEHWRCNFTMTYLDDTYWDRGVTPDVTWSLTDGQLAIIDPDHQIPQGRDYARGLSSLRRQIGWFCYGGLDYLSRLQEWKVHGTAEPHAWIIHGVHRGGAEYEYHVRWREDLSRFVVESRVLAASPSRPESVGERILFQDWTFDKVLGEPVSRVVTRVSAADKPTHEYHLEAFEPLGQSDLDRLLQVPDVAREDPVRGSLTVTSVYDYRPDKKQVTRISAEGSMQQRLVVPEQHTETWWRTAGWILLSLLIIVFLGLWLRNHRGA